MNEQEGPGKTMSETMFCGQCGTQVPAAAKFCLDCGEPQQPEPEPVPAAAPPPSIGALPRAAERVERVAPGAGELAGELAQRLQTPGAVAAAVVGGVALLTCLVVGLFAAVASPDRTVIGAFHAGDGVLTEALRLTVATTLAPVKVAGGSESFRLLPLIFGIAPFLGGVIGARVAAPSLTGMSVRDAMAWSAAGAVVFACVMLIIALAVNGQGGEQLLDLKFSIGSLLLLSVLLTGAGAAIGARHAARTVAPDRPGVQLSPVLAAPLRIAAKSLVGLAALLAVTMLVGFAHVEVQSIRGQQQAVGSVRSNLGAAIETVLFAPDIGIETAGLALFARFDKSALPVDDEKAGKLTASLDDEGRGRIFDYSGALPAYVFVPELLILMGAVLISALYCGFAMARTAVPRTGLIAAGWGALTGVVWAFALVILRSLAFGQTTVGDSVFVNALLIGAATGAIGGFLAFRPMGIRTPSAPGVVRG